MKFGVVGHPIGHSMSAVMHEAAFRALGLKHSYDLFDVAPEDLREFLKNNDFDGLNVTVPHKEAAFRCVEDLDENAKMIGAVNTINLQGRVKGYNTDGVGCIRALEEKGVEVHGKRILVIGAGGAARAVVFQLAKEGGEIYISNRTRERAESLARDVQERIGKKIYLVEYVNEKLRQVLSEGGILINATSVGMYPHLDGSVVSKDVLNKDVVVMDLVYNPLETRLLREAESVGCKTVSGVGMLVYQGVEALKIWLGINPPVEVMRKAVIDELG